MVKALIFKGDKKPKKRKRAEADGGAASSSTTAAAPSAEDVANDDSWVSAEASTDVSGPVVLVLPTSDRPAALSCDASGAVFALDVENLVDGNPASAEPHDVRQVWVANKVAGTESFRFKGENGKYLSCDTHGIFSATSEAVSAPECFKLIASESGPATFQVQTVRDTFLSVKPASSAKARARWEIRGDAKAASDETTIRIRMQARFKPRLQAAKEEKAREKISRKELEVAAGRRLEGDEVKRLKRARKDGDYHEQLLMIKAKSKHDKYS